MGIHQSDVWIREAILLGLEDIRKNIWLLEDILGDFTSSAYLTPKYSKQIVAAKEWFKNNNIEVVMSGRDDEDRFPCVVITLGSSREKPEMKTMADQSTDTVKLLPNTVGKPIPYVIKPFSVLSYDVNSGDVTIDPNVNLVGVSAGMILVNPANGVGYVINDLTVDGLAISPGVQFTTGSYGIVPQYQYYEARIEHTFFDEVYNIDCIAHGDRQALLWLHSIVLYSILRYRESLLEANGFTESVVSSSDIAENGAYAGPGGERAFARTITLTGQTESNWIKTPRRFIEAMELKSDTTGGYTGGIKILSNANSSDFQDDSQSNWITVDDTDGQYDDDSNS